jgi:hypothetical protein
MNLKNLKKEDYSCLKMYKLGSDQSQMFEIKSKCIRASQYASGLCYHQPHATARG